MMAQDDFKARKLRPIYDAIDNRNYKQVNKLCQKKDIAGWSMTKALRAYALERLGKTDEALEVAREVKAQNPTDEALLSTLALTFKLTGNMEEMTEMYEKALEQDPQNESRARDVYFCYARTREYKKQQQLAQKLYKTFNKPQYVYWAVTAMVQQYQHSPSGMGSTMLQLGEKMLEKVLREVEPDRQPSAEELQLYVHLLRLQGKTQEAVAALDLVRSRPFDIAQIHDEVSIEDGTVVKITPATLAALHTELMVELQDWSGAVSTLKDMLRKEPDNWANHKQLVKCTFSVAGESNIEELVRQTTELQQFIRELQAENPKLRGPYLSEMHLLCEWAKASNSSDVPAGWAMAANAANLELGSSASTVAGQIAVLVVAYFEIFDQRVCSFEDMKPYLAFLVSKGRQCIQLLVSHYAPIAHGLAESIMRQAIPTRTAPADEPDATYDAAAGALRRELFKYCRTKQVLCYLGALQRPRENIKLELNEMFQVYQHTLPLNDAATGGKREVQLGDELIMLMASLYKTAYATLVAELNAEVGIDRVPETEPLKILYEAAVVLQYGRKNSPFNFTFTMLLMEICRELGCVETTMQLFNALEIKHIQVDSLSYLLLPAALEGALFTEARLQHRNITTFHKQAPADTGDWLSKSFKHGNYSKALEITSFLSSKLSSSLQGASSKAQLPLLELLQIRQQLADASPYVQTYVTGMAPESMSQMDANACAALSQNMDFDVVVPLEHVSAEDREARDRTRRLEYEHEIRANTTLMSALLHVFQSSVPTADAFIDQLTAILSEGRDLQPSSITGQALLRGDCTGAGFELASTAVRCGGEKYTDLLHLTLLTLLRYTTVVTAVAQQQSGDVSGLELQTQLLVDLFRHLRTALLSDRGDHPAHRMCSDTNNEPSPLSPLWARRVSAFAVKVISVAVPLLQLCAQHVPSAKKAKKSKKAKDKAVDADSAQEAKLKLAGSVEATIQAFTQLLTDVAEVIREDVDDDYRKATHIAHYMLSDSVEALLSSLHSDSLKTAAKEVAEGMRSSHSIVALRLRQVLRDKISALSALL